MKPLGQKAYGSIPHLPKSRLGPGDWSIHEGQSKILTEKTRDKHDRIIVTEKLDGSCVAVAKINGEIIALSRSGFTAASSPFPHLQDFAVWVEKNRSRFAHLNDGQRVAGEWVTMAHGTIYEPLIEPFVPFDLLTGVNRSPHDELVEWCNFTSMPNAKVIHDGGPLSIDSALSIIGEFGFYGAKEQVEGAVWRVERKGSFDFIAKYVRPEKVDGKYLIGTSNAVNSEPLWFYRP